jgi:hypothetical protein
MNQTNMDTKNHQMWWRGLVIAFFIAIILLNGWLVYKIAFIRHWPDFEVFLEAGRRLAAGENPYVRTVHDQYWYPLFFAAVMIPFTVLPLWLSHYCWYAISVASLFVVLAETCHLLGIPKHEQYKMWGCIGVLFVSIIQADWMYGNVNLFLLALLMLCLRHRLTVYRTIVQTAVIIGTTISIKFAPIVMMLFIAFDWHREQTRVKITIANTLLRPVVAFGSVCGTVIVLCIGIPYLVAGAHIFDFYFYWWHDLMLGQIRNQPSANNYTLAGGLSQIILRHTPAPLWLQVVCGLFLGSFVGYLAYEGKRIYAFILCLMIMPLTGSRGQQHHLIVLIPAYIVLLKPLLYPTNAWLHNKMSTKILSYALIPAMLFCTLWGNHAPNKFPLDMVGLFGAFCTTFFVMKGDNNEQNERRTNVESEMMSGV